MPRGCTLGSANLLRHNNVPWYVLPTRNTIQVIKHLLLHQIDAEVTLPAISFLVQKLFFLWTGTKQHWAFPFWIFHFGDNYMKLVNRSVTVLCHILKEKEEWRELWKSNCREGKIKHNKRHKISHLIVTLDSKFMYILQDWTMIRAHKSYSPACFVSWKYPPCMEQGTTPPLCPWVSTKPNPVRHLDARGRAGSRWSPLSLLGHYVILCHNFPHRCNYFNWAKCTCSHCGMPRSDLGWWPPFWNHIWFHPRKKFCWSSDRKLN